MRTVWHRHEYVEWYPVVGCCQIGIRFLRGVVVRVYGDLWCNFGYIHSYIENYSLDGVQSHNT